MPSQSAHLFFSYAHDDAARLTPIHAQMQNVLERNLWLDKVGLERGMAWNNAIKAAIDDSYGVIFAVTKTFVTRPFILEREIPWALDRFKDKQGVQLFPILFDDVELPELLKTPYITYPIKAFEMSFEAVLEELKKKLPAPEAGVLPFIVDWPRLANFKGRDNQLIELHQQLMGDGRQGVKTVGLHGTGGIGKTQLAVEYAHRYRYHYPGGVYWLNGGADWRKEVAACAVNIDRNLIEKSDEEKTLAFRDYLAAQGKYALLVLDNVDDPADVTRREVAPRLTIAKICSDTRTRMLLTTRVQRLPEGFEDVSVSLLKPKDARAVLLDAWVSGGRKDEKDIISLDAIASTLGYLPLGLILATAALTKRPTLTPVKFLEHLREKGIDDIANRVGLEKAGPAGYVSRVDVALEWQIGQVERADARTLLALLAAFGEAAIVPRERMRLLAGLVDDDLDAPFSDAAAELLDYHLVEPQSEGAAFRLHPLTQVYLMRTLNPSERLNEAVPRLVDAYRDPATLDTQTRTRGFSAVLEDLASVQRLLSSASKVLDNLTRLLVLEESHLTILPKRAQLGYVIQQIRERTYDEGDDNLKVACDSWLKGKLYWHHNGLRYPLDRALLRILEGHRDTVLGALELRDGRIISWSDDYMLRLWKADGSPEHTLEGHNNSVRGALELRDGHILSWSDDYMLRLWKADGGTEYTLEGHNNSVRGALELRDRRIISWSSDKTLRLWKADGSPERTLEGHNNSVEGALELQDGRIISWSSDKTLRLWKADGSTKCTLEGHSDSVRGALELQDGRVLSWSSDKTLRLWKADGSPERTLEGHNNSVEGALELRDGRFLSWSSDKTLRLWKADGSPERTLEGHNNSVEGALELRDGRFLSWSSDKMLLWKADGSPERTLEGHNNSVRGALELQDGRILSWSFDRTLRLWKADGSPERTLEGHSDYIWGALELRDGRFISWSEDNTLRLWKADGSTERTLKGHSNYVSAPLELQDGRILSWSSDKTLRLWKADGSPERTLEGHSHYISGALELQDGRILSWSQDRTLRLWKADGSAERTLEGHSHYISGALELQDGRILSWSFDDRTLRLWKTDGSPERTLEKHSGYISGAVELRDGRILSWSYDRTLRLWKADGSPERTLQGHSDFVLGALELRDGRILSWSYDWTLRLWKADGSPERTLQGHSGSLEGALELRDGRILSWSSDKTLRLWKADGSPERTLQGHSDSLEGALELQDGRILSWSRDRMLRLWKADGSPERTLEGHSYSVRGALELRDGRILSWSYDRTLRLWSTNGEPLAVYSDDASLTGCTISKDTKRVVIGNDQGRMLVLKLEEGEI